jgi:hypothetical protein
MPPGTKCIVPTALVTASDVRCFRRGTKFRGWPACVWTQAELEPQGCIYRGGNRFRRAADAVSAMSLASSIAFSCMIL